MSCATISSRDLDLVLCESCESPESISTTHRKRPRRNKTQWWWLLKWLLKLLQQIFAISLCMFLILSGGEVSFCTSTFDLCALLYFILQSTVSFYSWVWSCRWREWEPPNTRPQFLGAKGCCAHSGLGMGCWLKWRSSRILGSCEEKRREALTRVRNIKGSYPYHKLWVVTKKNTHGRNEPPQKRSLGSPLETE